MATHPRILELIEEELRDEPNEASRAYDRSWLFARATPHYHKALDECKETTPTVDSLCARVGFLLAIKDMYEAKMGRKIPSASRPS